MVQALNYCYYMSHPMGKPTICIGENKGADQLRGNREADQRLCFRYSDSTLPLLPTYVSCFYLYSVLVQVGLCRTCSETTLLVFPRGGRIIYTVIFVIVQTWGSRETGEPRENHRTWMGDHYLAICPDPDLNPDSRGDKRERYPLCCPGPYHRFINLSYGNILT